MNTFVYGVSGGGKTSYVENCIKKDIEEGKRVFLIVPRQKTFLAQKRFASVFPPSAQLTFTHCSFNELLRIARRRYGGISYTGATNGAKSLLMWKSLRQISTLLTEYGEAAKIPSRLPSLSDLMIKSIDELTNRGITPALLDAAADRLDDGTSLCGRLRDLSMIWSSYLALLAEKYGDASDDFSALDEILSKHDMFKGTKVYIDSFSAYPGKVYSIVDRIMKQADEVTITFPCDGPRSERMHFASIVDMSDKFRKIAGDNGGVRDIILGESLRFKTSDLGIVEKALWKGNGLIAANEAGSTLVPSGISVIKAKNPYNEAEAVACEIAEAVRNGMRYRDIAVITRDISEWNGIIDAIFDKFKIPYFMSEHTELISKPLFKLIMSALNIKNRNWRQTDVISLLKTGLLGFDESECDIFEDYCATWNISGKKFLDEVWTMNPDGYSDEMTERSKSILASANKLKDALTAPLIRLFTKLNAASSTVEQCAALYSYTEEINVRDSLDALAEKERNSGDIRSSGELLRLYGIYIEALDELSEVLEDINLDTSEFAVALKIYFENSDIGSYPARCDEVVIGSAPLLKLNSPAMVIVTGLCDGVFPADIVESRLFSFSERERLKSVDLTVSNDLRLESADELFFVYNAMTAPSEKLVLTYSETGSGGQKTFPSPVIEKLTELFPKTEIHDFDRTSVLRRIQNEELALEYLSSLENEDEKRALKEILSKNADTGEKLAALDIPVRDAFASVSEVTSSIIFADTRSLSQSRIETYVKCPFNYYCNYVLSLRDSKPAEFGSVNIGIFIHFVLEQFMRMATAGGTRAPKAENVGEMTDKIISEYNRLYIDKNETTNGRVHFLIEKIKRIAVLAVNDILGEFAQSAFRPAFFEYGIAAGSKYLYGIGNGEMINLRGFVDRIDLYYDGKDMYVRVVDYKSGNKKYSEDDVADGVGLQLLLYLYALCDPKNYEFRKKLGIADNVNVYPAGAQYLSTKISKIVLSRNFEEEFVKGKATEKLTRSGPLLNDDAILYALNSENDPHYLGANGRGRPMLTLSEFLKKEEQIGKTIAGIREKMLSGDASAIPRIKYGETPCNFCPYAEICRSGEIKKIPYV